MEMLVPPHLDFSSVINTYHVTLDKKRDLYLMEQLAEAS